MKTLVFNALSALARKLCSHCKKEHEVPRETLLHEGFPEDKIGTFKLYSPVGCDHFARPTLL